MAKAKKKTSTNRETAFVDVDKDTVDDRGFFCYMSKKKSEGYKRKLAWLKDRFDEGMRIKMLEKPGRGFIEYLHAEYAWRAVHAEGFMFVHCLWVVGKSKGQGLGRALLEECIADAKRSKMKGVVALTSKKVWLVGPKLFKSLGFECVEELDPGFSLMVKRFGKKGKKSDEPRFAGDWDKKAEVCGKGLTILRSDQCPYVVDAVKVALEAAEEAGIKSQVIELKTRDDVINRCPNPYGVFGLALDGKPLSYHYLLKKDLVPLLTK